MTHGDEIRCMTDEEIVDALIFRPNSVCGAPPGRNCLCDCKLDSCRACWLDYLGEEAGDGKKPSDAVPNCISCQHGKQISPDGFDGIKCPFGGNIVQPWATCCDEYAPKMEVRQ